MLPKFVDLLLHNCGARLHLMIRFAHHVLLQPGHMSYIMPPTYEILPRKNGLSSTWLSFKREIIIPETWILRLLMLQHECFSSKERPHKCVQLGAYF
ncbi:MAG: hypothetical protein CMF65_12310 [Magnetovibrio sp.]|nr:hypothetical protein [Magnetovibrio sp.]